MGEMKQGQVETVTVTFSSVELFYQDNLVAQYNTPSYYHKTFENKLNWKLQKLFFALTEYLSCRISEKIEKISFLIEHIQAFIYLFEKSSYGLQIKHSVW